MTKTSFKYFLPRLLNNLHPLSLFNRLVLAAIILAILLFIFWASTTWIFVKDRGNGIYLNENGLFLITADEDGSIISFNVQDGQKVEKGELLIQIENSEEKIKLETLRLRVQNLKNEHALLKTQIQLEDEARKNAIKREIETYQNLMKQNEQEIKSYSYSLALRKRFYDQGLINFSLVQQVEMDLVQTEIENEAYKEKISTLYVDLNSSYRTKELAAIKSEINSLEYQLSLIKEDTNIYSTENGTILSVLKNPGVGIKKGDALIILEPESAHPNENVIYGYFSIESGQNIEKGTPVEIVFTHISSNEYGSIMGVVDTVSEYAVSADHLMNIFHNKEIINFLLGNYSAVIEVVIKPLRDPENPDAFVWSSNKSPSIPITTGSFCTLYAIIDEIRPLYFVSPVHSLKRNPHIEEVISDER